MRVTLTPYELRMAAQVGIARHIASIEDGRKPAHGASEDTCWQIHCEGACGEMALAKALGVYWNGSVNTFKKPDVGGIHVRTRSLDWHELYIRRDDPPGIYALVTGLAPHYWLRGWFPSGDVRDEWLADHGGRERAWFMPHDVLRGVGSMLFAQLRRHAETERSERQVSNGGL